jgi:hypothetical protein
MHLISPMLNPTNRQHGVFWAENDVFTDKPSLVFLLLWYNKKVISSNKIMSPMKHLALVSLAFLPAVAFAGVTDTLLVLDNQGLFAAISLWSMLIVAFATSMMVWVGGRQMHGGVFGSVLTYFSVGMFLIFLGAATNISWLQSVQGLYLKLAHDSLFIVGYILMGIAASKPRY